MKAKKIKKPLIVAAGILLVIVVVIAISLMWLYGKSDKIEKYLQTIPTPEFYITSNVGNEEIKINAYTSYKDGKTYVFLPGVSGGGRFNSLCIASESVAPLRVNGEEITSGELTDVIKSPGEYTIEVDSKKYETVFIKSEGLPSVHITTDENSLAKMYENKDLKQSAAINIYNDEELILSDSLKYIKGRGNASWDFPQKSFNIKFEQKINLFDMGKAKKYSLVATYADPTLLKDNIIYNLADNIGLEYSSKCTQVDLYIDNNYLGNYLLVESVEVGKKRVHINDLDDANELANPDIDIESLEQKTTASDLSSTESGTARWVDIPNEPTDITQGYLLQLEIEQRYITEASGFITENSQPIVLKSPEYATKGEIDFISKFYQDFENALYSPDGLNEEGKHYTEYIDIESFAKMYLVEELAQNRDANVTSTYMYLKNGKLYAGPVWDFDNALGNQVLYSTMNDPNNYDEDKLEVCFQGFFSRLFAHADFRKQVNSEYKTQFRQAALDCINYLDDTSSQISGSAVMNAIRWNRLGITDINENDELYSKAVDELKNFLNARIELFDKVFTEDSSVLIYCTGSLRTSESIGECAKSGDEVTISDNPCTRNNLKFNGWNTMPDGSGESYAPGDKLTLDGEAVMLYPQYSGEDKMLKVKNKISNMYNKVANSLKYRINVVNA